MNWGFSLRPAYLLQRFINCWLGKHDTQTVQNPNHYSNVAVTKAIYCVFPLHHHTVRCTVGTWVTAQSGTRGLPRIKCFQTTWSWSLETNVWGGRIWLAQQEMLQLHAYWSFLQAMLVPEGTDCIFAIFLECIYIVRFLFLGSEFHPFWSICTHVWVEAFQQISNPCLHRYSWGEFPKPTILGACPSVLNKLEPQRLCPLVPTPIWILGSHPRSHQPYG